MEADPGAQQFAGVRAGQQVRDGVDGRLVRDPEDEAELWHAIDEMLARPTIFVAWVARHSGGSTTGFSCSASSGAGGSSWGLPSSCAAPGDEAASRGAARARPRDDLGTLTIAVIL